MVTEATRQWSATDDRPFRRLRRLQAVLVGSLALAILTFCGGFFAFVATIERSEPRGIPPADGIVALTGGPDRIADAVTWLSEGRGQRLLISGVDSHTPLERVVRETPALKAWLHCCIDVDREARNTVGNALETGRWAARRGYRSLVVVTSSHHMPRALVEFRRQMPDVTLIPAPVVTERLRALDMWRDPALVKTLGHEYGKFLVSYVRARLTGALRSDDMAASHPRRQVL
ncbi:MAG: YdcF family protein [Beijerinckiaceae bacterium]